MDDEEVQENEEDKELDIVEAKFELVATDDEEELNAKDKEKHEEASNKNEEEEDQYKNKDNDDLHAPIEEEMEEVDVAIQLKRNEKKENKNDLFNSINKFFECACEHPIEAKEVNKEEIDEDAIETYLEPIFMKWGFEEIKYYYALILHQPNVKYEDGRNKPNHINQILNMKHHEREGRKI